MRRLTLTAAFTRRLAGRARSGGRGRRTAADHRHRHERLPDRARHDRHADPFEEGAGAARERPARDRLRGDEPRQREERRARPRPVAVDARPGDGRCRRRRARVRPHQAGRRPDRGLRGRQARRPADQLLVLQERRRRRLAHDRGRLGARHGAVRRRSCSPSRRSRPTSTVAASSSCSPTGKRSRATRLSTRRSPPRAPPRSPSIRLRSRARASGPAPLQRLAKETGGRYQGASGTAALHAIYAALGEELRRTWSVSYVTTARPGERIELVSAGASAEAVAPGEAAAGRIRRKLEAGALLRSRPGRRLPDRRPVRPARHDLPLPRADRLRPEAPDRPAPGRGRAEAGEGPGAGALRDCLVDHAGDRGCLRPPPGLAQAAPAARARRPPAPHGRARLRRHRQRPPGRPVPGRGRPRAPLHRRRDGVRRLRSRSSSCRSRRSAV